jgi:type IV pilus assembly protein PilQ
MRRIGTLAALTIAALGLGAGVARAAHNDGPGGRPALVTAETVTAVSVVPGDGRADVVIALTGPVRVEDFTAEGPDRIIIDLSGARVASIGKPYDRRTRGGIRNIRYSQFGPTVVRIVLDLDTKVPYAVTRSDDEVRISVATGERFAAWYSRDEQVATPVVEPPAMDSSEATGSVATGQVTLPVKPAAAPAIGSVEEIIPVAQAAVPPRTAPLFAQQSQQARITITWEDAPIQDVLAVFAEVSGRTIVRGKEVTGNVSAEIKDQPWDIAMKAILDAHGLAATEENSGIIVVDSYENILTRQASEPLTTQFVAVNYVSAASLVETVRGLLSKDCPAGAAAQAADQSQQGQGGCITRGTVSADSGTNSLLIQEVASRLPGLLQYVAQLDVRTPQVFLKAKIISVSRTSIEQLGMSYDLGSSAAYFNRLVPRNRPGSETADDRDGRVTLGGEVLAGVGNASRKYSNNSALNLLFSTALGKYSLTAFLDALREQQLSDIQAEPSIVTLDNREAKMLVGEETPVRVIDAGAAAQVAVPARANVQFKETGIILTVTPHITNNRQVRMSIAAEQSELRIIGGDLGFTIPKRNATTQLLVNDGETAVIGGLTQTQVVKNKSGIPLLSDLPVIGRMFSQTDTREEKRDLLILITPHIIDAGEAVRPPDGENR